MITPSVITIIGLLTCAALFAWYLGAEIADADASFYGPPDQTIFKS